MKVFNIAPKLIKAVLVVGMVSFMILQAYTIHTLEQSIEARITTSYALEDAFRESLVDSGTPTGEAYDLVQRVKKLAPLTRGFDGLDGKAVLSLARDSLRLEDKQRVQAVMNR